MTTSVIVLSGGDEVLLAGARTALVRELVGDGDPTLIVDEYAGDEYELHAVADAAQTLPFLTDHRVVVARGVHRFDSADAWAPIVQYLAQPLESTVLVLEWGGSGRVKKLLKDAVTAAGGEVRPTGPGRKVADWVRDAIAESGLRPDRGAGARIADWVGEDAGKLPGLLTLLRSTYGPGARISESEVEPFLDADGGVPPWDLTDAIDRGDIAASLVALRRMLGAGRHPLQVMATVHSHFQRMLRLDGADVRSEKDAATLLGMKGSTFPAKKALSQSRKLGGAGVRRSIALLAAADLDLRGQVAWPPELVMEVLVARLAHTAR